MRTILATLAATMRAPGWLPLALLACSAPAVAQGPATPAVQVEWSAPAAQACPDRAYVLRELNQRLSRSTASASLTATGALTLQPSGRYRLELTTRLDDVPGERVFEDASCQAVTDAAVVVLAWMVDPDAVSAPAPHVVRPAPERERRPPSTVPVGRTAVERRAPALLLELAPQMDLGSLPGVAIGAELKVGARLSRVELTAFAASFAPQQSVVSHRASDGAALGGKFDLATFGVEACVAASVSPALRFAACAGPEVDWLNASGVGVSAPTSANAAWIALRAGGFGALALNQSLSLVLATRAIVPSRREHFALHNVGEVHRADAISFRVGLGLQLAF